MLQSAFCEFQKNQSATLRGELIIAAASQYLSAYLDAGASRDWGAGTPVYAYFLITSAAVINNAATVQVQIVGSDTVPTGTGAGAASDGTNPVVLADSGTVANASLTAGTYHRIGVLASGSLKRYLGAKVTIGTGTPTTGAMVCALSFNSALLASYADLTNSLQ